jgi:hypothetical protein
MDGRDEIRRLEEQLLSEPVRRSEARLMDLLAPDFVEFGASGQIWDRVSVIGALTHAQPARYKLLSFRAHFLTADVAHATYELQRFGNAGAPTAHSLRSSIWVRKEQRWRLTFHQGTLRPQ